MPSATTTQLSLFDISPSQLLQMARSLPDTEAIKPYATLRAAVVGAHARGERAARAAWQAMIMTGNAIKERIPSNAFDQLMDKVDAAATAAAH